jgi:hypothetical protein
VVFPESHSLILTHMSLECALGWEHFNFHKSHREQSSGGVVLLMPFIGGHCDIRARNVSPAEQQVGRSSCGGTWSPSGPHFCCLDVSGRCESLGTPLDVCRSFCRMCPTYAHLPPVPSAVGGDGLAVYGRWTPQPFLVGRMQISGTSQIYWSVQSGDRHLPLK